jgi:hypothetical protein
MGDPASLAGPAATALIQYGALGVICLLLTAGTAWLIVMAFRKAAQNEADCKERDAQCRERDARRQDEIAAIRLELMADRTRLHDSIANLAAIAQALGKTAVDKQIETDRILFRK